MTTNTATDSAVITKEDRESERVLKADDVAILRFMAAFADKHLGIPPTYRDIMSAVGITSTSVVTFRLDRLVLRGYCYRLPSGIDKRRATTISQQGRAYLARLHKAARR
jgi:DNA-binding MarR family transcriptional regulator